MIPISTSVIKRTIKTTWSTVITLMMGVIRAGSRPRSTSPNYINTFSGIEQVRVFDIFISNSIPCTVTPNISYSGGIVSGMGPISNSPTTTNSISLKSTIYHVCLGYGRNSGFLETYIHLSLQHQLMLPDRKRKSGWYIVT